MAGTWTSLVVKLTANHMLAYYKVRDLDVTLWQPSAIGQG